MNRRVVFAFLFAFALIVSLGYIGHDLKQVIAYREGWYSRFQNTDENSNPVSVMDIISFVLGSIILCIGLYLGISGITYADRPREPKK